MLEFPYTIDDTKRIQIGLITLQSDETIEFDFRKLLRPEIELMVARVPSAPTVSSETLAEMAQHLETSAARFPTNVHFQAVGYGCTSGAAEIGPENVAEHITAGTQTDAVSDPTSALIAACHAHGIKRLTILSPYVESVSAKLRSVLFDSGISTVAFGSFNEPEEARVARIDEPSIIHAAKGLCKETETDALFISCTNLRTLNVITALEEELQIPVFSSNLVLAWHLQKLTKETITTNRPERIWQDRG